MDKLIKEIENSERNNQQFKAALEEIDHLQEYIREIKNVFFGTDFKEKNEYGVERCLSSKEQEDVKIDLLTALLS